MLQAAFEGYNACVFAYGQTGSGKTHTMMGYMVSKSLYGYGMTQWNRLPADVRRDEDRISFAATIRKLVMEE